MNKNPPQGWRKRSSGWGCRLDCVTSPAGAEAVQALSYTQLTSRQTWWHHQQILLYLSCLHSKVLSHPHPTVTWLSPEDTSPSGCSEQIFFFVILLFSQKTFFWQQGWVGGVVVVVRGIEDSSSSPLLLFRCLIFSFLLLSSFSFSSSSLPPTVLQVTIRFTPDQSTLGLFLPAFWWFQHPCRHHFQHLHLMASWTS